MSCIELINLDSAVLNDPALLNPSPKRREWRLSHWHSSFKMIRWHYLNPNTDGSKLINLEDLWSRKFITPNLFSHSGIRWVIDLLPFGASPIARFTKPNLPGLRVLVSWRLQDLFWAHDEKEIEVLAMNWKRESIVLSRTRLRQIYPYLTGILNNSLEEDFDIAN